MDVFQVLYVRMCTGAYIYIYVICMYVQYVYICRERERDVLQYVLYIIC